MALFKRKSTEPELRPCPRCNEMMDREALDCPHCGLDLREAYHPPAEETLSARE